MPSNLAQIFAQAEGFGIAGTIPTVANNPGSLELGDIGYGTIQASGGNQITVFPSLTSGWNALENQLNKMLNGTSQYYNPSQTLSQISQTYGGGSTWANNVASLAGVTPNATLAQTAAAANGNTTSSYLSNALSSAEKLEPKASFSPSSLFFGGVSFEDIVCVTIGILFIGGAIFAFKNTSTVVNTGVRWAGHARRIATAAAEVAA